MLKQSLINVEKNCPRKIRDKEHSAEQKLTECQFLREEDENEFLECHLEKVSSGGSKVRGDNCDTRLNMLTDENQLTEIFFSGVKSQDELTQKRVGVEFEKLPVLKKDFSAAPYFQVAKILQSLKSKSNDWQDSISEDNAILGLLGKNGTVTLEPGSQTEISLYPSDSIDKISAVINSYNKFTSDIAKDQGVLFLGYGIQPVSTYKNISIIPKKRYEYMTKYLPTVAKKPLIMMRETAGIQASFDYSDEQDAMKKFATALKLSPIISAVYSNSPIRNGRLTKYKSNRAASWLDTDNDRCGLVSAKVFSGEFSFSKYAQILLDVPMIFIEREINGVNTAIKVNNLTFRQFMKQGYEGFFAQKNDWETHLSLYFSDVRLKSYIEIRNHDNQRSNLICSVPAFWKGIIYNESALDAVNDVLKRFTYFDFEYIRRKAPQYGLDMKIKHLSLADLAKEIVDISYQSLKSFNQGEEKYLGPIKAFVDKKITPADVLIDKWNNEWNAQLSELVKYSELR